MKKNEIDDFDKDFEDIKINYSDVDYDNVEVYENKKKLSIFRIIFFLITLIIIVTIIYARYVGTTGLIIKEYQIKNKNLPSSFNGFKIAHFSDFHYGSTTNIDSLKNLVTEINLMKPDIIIFTGDFIDKNVKISEEEINNISNQLLKLKSSYGNYYVSGNHDLKMNNFDEMMINSNFINLNNTYKISYSKDNESILLNGIGYKNSLSGIAELANNKISNYKINIMHTPDTFLKLKDYNFDLVLAGHSHNGQVSVPFYGAIYTPDNAKVYYKPYYKVDNTDFFISSGIGTSKYNFRLFNRPSFNFYRLKNSE